MMMDKSYVYKTQEVVKTGRIARGQNQNASRLSRDKKGADKILYEVKTIRCPIEQYYWVDESELYQIDEI